MYQVEIQEDESGEQFIQIPQEIIEEMGWNEFTILNMELVNGNIHMTQRTNWTAEELQEGDTLDNVMDDVVNNGTTHFIEHEGRTFMLRPYNEETDEKLEN